MDPQSIVLVATPIVVPLVIAGVKLILPKIPTWLLPIIAPFLGAGIDVIQHFSTGADMNVWLAAGLGLAGTGMREVLDQVKKVTISTK